MRSNILIKIFTGTALVTLISACGPTATFPPSPTQPPAVNPPATEPSSQAASTPTRAPLPTPTSPTDISRLTNVSTPDIQVLQMLDVNNGWALSGAISGLGVLRTADGGITWHDASPIGISSRPSNGFFLSEAEAWVLVSGADMTSGTLYRTTDGGANWDTTVVPFGSASLEFTDPQNGWALASLGFALSHEAVAVYRTHDGGLTWTEVFTDDPQAPNTSDSLPFAGDKSGLTALDDQRAWVTGSEPVSDYIYLFATTDGGKTWTEQNPPLPPSFAGGMTNSFPVEFLFDNTAVLQVNVYANTTSTILYISHDEGKTWAPTTPAPIAGKISTPNSQDFFAWDGGATIYTSHDSGKTWSPVATNVNFPDELASFQFEDFFTGWAVTSDANSHYKLYKTLDGGMTWDVIVP